MQNVSIPQKPKVSSPFIRILTTIVSGDNHLINGLIATIAVGSIWFGLSDLSRDIRISFIIFALSVVGWCLTSINDTYIALFAAVALTVLGLEESDQFFAALGDSTIWLLLASFVIAAGVTASGLSNRLTLLIANRARSVNQLFFLLTGVLMVTAFIIPATSGRAALMVPIFSVLSSKIKNKRIIKALALLFPTIILLSAVGSLIGAGAHLIAVEVLLHMAGEKINFARWMMLGLPFAVVSCFGSTWVILRLFLTPQERRKKLHLTFASVAVEENKPRRKSSYPTSSQGLSALIITLVLVSFWATQSLHNIDITVIPAEILSSLREEPINFTRWMKLSVPLVVLMGVITWVVVQLFLTSQDRRQRQQLNVGISASKRQQTSANTLDSQEWYALIIVLALVLLWSTESLHGIDGAIIALLGAIAVTAPNIGIISFKEGIKQVNWNLLLFLAATLKLGDALSNSGGAEWLVNSFFNRLENSFTNSTFLVISVIALVSLLSHLLINSRSARASVLLPLVIILGQSLGYNPTALVFMSTAAAGFCLTLPISAKPVAMFSHLNEPTYEPQDLLHLSSILLPLHFVLLLIFTLFIWPAMGLSLTN